MKTNAALYTDGYKTDHRRQYPEGTEFVHSNMTARSSNLSNLPKEAHNNEVVVFGVSYLVQKFLIDFWNDNFFNRNVDDVCREYEETILEYLGPNDIGSQHIRDLHNLGYLPIRIKSLKEGTKCPIQVPFLVIENTHKDFFWVTNYLETVISTVMWKPITSATTANAYRQLISKYAIDTVGNTDFVPFQGHDFSFRGLSGVDDAVLSGMAHLTSFVGTDTIPSIPAMKRYYECSQNEMIGVSVPASEHSVMCMGEKDSEVKTFKRFINDLYPSGIVSIVSDTWDYWKVISVSKYKKFKRQIISVA